MLRISITTNRQQRQLEHPAGPLEFGRVPSDKSQRVVLDDPHVSRDQLRIIELPGDRLRAENLSQKTPVRVGDGSVLGVGQSREFALPVRFTAGRTLLVIASPTCESTSPWQTILQPRMQAPAPRVRLDVAELGDSLTPEVLANWFETVLAVQRSAAGSPEFYAETARAVVDLVGMDSGQVLLRRCETGDDDWEAAAVYNARGAPKSPFSRTILGRVVEERRTFYRAFDMADLSGSMVGVEAIVVSPIFDADGKVVGAVYGSRTQGSNHRRPEIHPLEAQIVQILAAAAGSGLARVQREAEAARSRVQFEQFFSSALAQELERDPALLDGRDREVTVLFTDIRGYSSLSEKLGAAEACQLLADYMERITARIVQHSGVVVDYYGDGVMAMWNAPTDQPDHAERACRAALDILAESQALNAAWSPRLGVSLALGAGLNTGIARVGNTGSRRRFKYGPLGHAVNLGSRVEGATKHLGVPVLITGATKALLPDELPTRRLCRARLVGIETPVDLYELHVGPATPEWLTRRDAYEHALELYESGRWAESCRAVYPLLTGHMEEHDVATLSLLARAVECLKSPPSPFDPVVEFTSK